MKNKLVPQDDKYEVIAVDGIPVVSSRKIAEMFKKQHGHVMRDINDIVGGLSKIGESEWQGNFIQSTYKNLQNKKQPEFLLTKDGFTLVAMGFSGQKAMKYKIDYINRFNEMEKFLLSRNLAKLEYPELTNMIKSVHEKPMFYHYSNEADMINKIVLGMTAKQYRAAYNLDKTDSIRDFITYQQLDFIQKLQKVDVGLVAAISDFRQREEILRSYYSKLKESAEMKMIAQ